MPGAPSSAQETMSLSLVLGCSLSLSYLLGPGKSIYIFLWEVGVGGVTAGGPQSLLLTLGLEITPGGTRVTISCVVLGLNPVGCL